MFPWYHASMLQNNRWNDCRLDVAQRVICNQEWVTSVVIDDLLNDLSFGLWVSFVFQVIMHQLPSWGRNNVSWAECNYSSLSSVSMMKLPTVTILLFLLYSVSEGSKLNHFVFELRPNINYDWKPFISNLTIELNFETGNKTSSWDHLSIQSFEVTSCSEYYAEQIDQLKSIRFTYLSPKDPKAIFAIDRLVIGQELFRDRDFYYTSFAIDAPVWLNQNEWYVGHPSIHWSP